MLDSKLTVSASWRRQHVPILNASLRCRGYTQTVTLPEPLDALSVKADGLIRIDSDIVLVAAGGFLWDGCRMLPSG